VAVSRSWRKPPAKPSRSTLITRGRAQRSTISDIYDKKKGALDFIVKTSKRFNQRNEFLAELRAVSNSASMAPPFLRLSPRKLDGHRHVIDLNIEIRVGLIDCDPSGELEERAHLGVVLERVFDFQAVANAWWPGLLIVSLYLIAVRVKHSL
jgi:hypothetical protein